MVFALETFSSFLKILVLNTEKIDKYSTEKIDKLKNILTYDVGKCHNVVFGQGKSFDFWQFPRLVHVWNDFPKSLQKIIIDEELNIAEQA